MPKEDKTKPATEEEKAKPPKPPEPRGDEPRELDREELEELRRRLERKFH